MKFENSLQKLERIVAELESENISLDNAIKKYQDGLLLVKECLDLLDKAEKKIQICIKDKDGQIKIKPFKEKEQDVGEN